MIRFQILVIASRATENSVSITSKVIGFDYKDTAELAAEALKKNHFSAFHHVDIVPLWKGAKEL